MTRSTVLLNAGLVLAAAVITAAALGAGYLTWRLTSPPAISICTKIATAGVR